MNTLIQIIFGLVAALVVGSATMAMTVRNIIHSALWLIACFFGVGALYLLLEAEFIAVVQVLVYVGAVSILILFAIMLTRHTADEQPLNRGWWAALILAALLFGAVLVPTLLNAGWTTIPPTTDPAAAPTVGGAKELGLAFVNEYVLAFEVIGVLLLAALIGAIVVASEEKNRRRILTLAEELALRQRKAPAAPVTPPAAELPQEEKSHD